MKLTVIELFNPGALGFCNLGIRAITFEITFFQNCCTVSCLVLRVKLSQMKTSCIFYIFLSNCLENEFLNFIFPVESADAVEIVIPPSIVSFLYKGDTFHNMFFVFAIFDCRKSLHPRFLQCVLLNHCFSYRRLSF